MYRQGGDSGPALRRAAVGASVMGVWSAVSTTAASSLQQERRQGTLELLVAAPTPFPLLIVPITLSMATIGLYSLVATLLWGRFVFGIPIARRPARSRSSLAVRRHRDRRSAARASCWRCRSVRYRVGLGARLRAGVAGLADLRLPRAAVAAARTGSARSRGCCRRPGAWPRSGPPRWAASPLADIVDLPRPRRSRTASSAHSAGPTADRLRPGHAHAGADLMSA